MIEKDYVELIIGKGVCPLEHPASVAVDYVEQTWIVTLAAFFQCCRRRIVTNNKRVVKPQRDSDVYLMSFTDNMGKSEQAAIQRCRLYLQVTTLADVSDITGTIIDKRVWVGKRNRSSKLLWPRQGVLPQSDWSTWNKFLHRFTTNSTKCLKSEYKLGTWRCCYQHWRWLSDGNIVTDNVEGWTYIESKIVHGQVYYRRGPHMKKDGLPVLVKVERNHVRTTQMVIEEPVVREGSSLEKIINTLRPALRQLVGQYKCCCLPKMHNNKKLAVAIDGSVKKIGGGASVVIDNGEGGGSSVPHLLMVT